MVVMGGQQALSHGGNGKVAPMNENQKIITIQVDRTAAVILLVAAILIGGGTWGYTAWQEQQEIEAANEKWRKEADAKSQAMWSELAIRIRNAERDSGRRYQR